MRPDEIEALRDAGGRRTRRQWLVVALVTVLVALVPVGIYVVTGNLDHLLGNSEEVTARVERVETDGSCRGRPVDRLDVEVSWTVDGTSGHGSYSRCDERLAVGDSVQVWVAPNGTMSPESPTELRSGLLVGSVLLALAGAGSGAAMILMNRGRRRRLLAARTAPLGPPVRVRVKQLGRGRATVRLVDPAPGVVDPRPSAVPVIHFRPGRRPGTMTTFGILGEWWLHVAPIGDPRRQHGVLVRGDERLWVEFRLPPRKRQ
ncbi:hypothetical protein [Georgenia sp. Z1491]|uniref:hypothetical protein n=1 Tax=Georgenia sp. Z1491 TaxID=3416707 RepID=UPI003CF1AF48